MLKRNAVMACVSFFAVLSYFREVIGMLFWKKKPVKPEYDYDPERERPVIKASICTGEQVAGFKNKTTGSFHEVMLIRNEADRASFRRLYGLEHIDKEY